MASEKSPEYQNKDPTEELKKALSDGKEVTVNELVTKLHCKFNKSEISSALYKGASTKIFAKISPTVGKGSPSSMWRIGEVTEKTQEKTPQKSPERGSKNATQMAQRLLAFADKIPSRNQQSLDGDILDLLDYLRQTPMHEWSRPIHKQLLEYYRYVCTLEDPHLVSIGLRQSSQMCKVGDMVHWMGKEDGQVYMGKVEEKRDFDDILVSPYNTGWYASGHVMWQSKISIHMSQLVEYSDKIMKEAVSVETNIKGESAAAEVDIKIHTPPGGVSLS